MNDNKKGKNSDFKYYVGITIIVLFVLMLLGPKKFRVDLHIYLSGIDNDYYITCDDYTTVGETSLTLTHDGKPVMTISKGTVTLSEDFLADANLRGYDESFSFIGSKIDQIDVIGHTAYVGNKLIFKTTKPVVDVYKICQSYNCFVTKQSKSYDEVEHTRLIDIPVAEGEGNYYYTVECYDDTDETLEKLKSEGFEDVERIKANTWKDIASNWVEGRGWKE